MYPMIGMIDGISRGFDGNTLFLLRATGTGFDDFADVAGSTTITETGTGVNVSTGTKKFSSNEGSIQFASASYLNLPNSGHGLHPADNTSGYTVDWWQYKTVPDGNVLGFGNSTEFISGYTSSNHLYVSSNGATWDIASGRVMGTVTINTWQHFAIVWTGSNWYTFKDGVQQATWASSSTPYQSNNFNTIGYWLAGGAYLTGYLEEFRISSTARWTSGFTPPTDRY